MKPMELIEQGRFLGEEFLLWLWMRGLTEGGTSGKDGDLSACFIDDEVMLVSERGDVKELSMRKGTPQESTEAFEALSRGMRPCRAKVRMLAGDMEWVFTLGAAHLEISAMKLPPTQAKDLHGRVSDRLFLLEEGTSHIEHRFAIFLTERANGPKRLEKAFKGWIEGALGQHSDDSVEDPQ
jgi:recombination associated protein RdgC